MGTLLRTLPSTRSRHFEAFELCIWNGNPKKIWLLYTRLQECTTEQCISEQQPTNSAWCIADGSRPATNSSC